MNDPKTTEIVNVTITAPDAEWLVDLVRSLIESRLVAAGNVTEGVRSLYRWEGQVEEAEEAAASLRTQARHVPAIIEATKSKHPYEVAHVVATPIIGSNPDYQQWVVEATAAPSSL